MTKPIHVGDTFKHVRECAPYQPLYYAAASGDFNPIHIDRDVGEAAGLGGNILHGLCTMAWAVEGAIAFLGDPGRISRVRVRFSKPVRVGDTLSFEGRVVELNDTKVVIEVAAKNQTGDDVLKGAVVEARL